MRRTDFAYELPPTLIAQAPLAERSASRLLCLDGATGDVADAVVADLPGCLRAGDLLVFNDTRVIPARVFGRKASGGRVELLVERLLDDARLLALVRSSKSPKAAACTRRSSVATTTCSSCSCLRVPMRSRGSRPWVTCRCRPTSSAMTPPPTVSATRPCSPTAPVRSPRRPPACTSTPCSSSASPRPASRRRAEHVADHRMHAEWLEVPQETCDAVAAARARGGRVVAVGTTTVRSLETAAGDGTLRPFVGETRLFITPGYAFRVVDLMVTNFHLPESTLLMLVCAFAGTDHVLAAYRHAVAARYRFFSYGDAMLVSRARGEG
jgi:S-adenosylmethionine:tRNA ribosyltransferase-isomerase